MSDTVYPENLQLVYYPAPVLRQVAEPVTEFDQGLADFCQKMVEKMEESSGVGLAAPQVGVSKRIFTTNHTGTGEDVIPDRRIWINPVIKAEPEAGEHSYEEGCLSIPGCYSKVTRPARIHITWQDVTGAEHSASFDANSDEFLSTICQHELDHLDGVLFLDFLSRPSIQLLKRKLKGLEKDYKRAFKSPGKPLRL